MKFPDATAPLVERVGVTMEEVAAALGVTPTSVSRWRSDDRPEYPKPGWEPTVAELLRESARRHKEHARKMERLAKKLDGEAP